MDDEHGLLLFIVHSFCLLKIMKIKPLADRVLIEPMAVERKN